VAKLLEQLPALLGVIVGALLSFVGTSFLDRSRWRRDQLSRWDKDRKIAYSEYAYIVKTLTSHCVRMAAARGVTERFTPVDIETGMEDYKKLSLERSAKWEEVLLLGDDSTIEAARDWHKLVWHLDKFARGLESDPEVFSLTYAEAGKARDRFYECARRDLKI
jgi:hypothetical protein